MLCGGWVLQLAFIACGPSGEEKSGLDVQVVAPPRVAGGGALSGFMVVDVRAELAVAPPWRIEPPWSRGPRGKESPAGMVALIQSSALTGTPAIINIQKILLQPTSILQQLRADRMAVRSQRSSNTPPTRLNKIP